jgi:SAM-dependent MidA family methyltransferase
LRQIEHDSRPQSYLILERSADLRRIQREYIKAEAPHWLERVSWLDEPPGEDWDGVILANEVLDSLAVERFRVADDGIEQACVTIRDRGFDWEFLTAPEALKDAVERLKLNLPSGYCSELNLLLPEWLRAISCSMRTGVALIVDYGYPRSEYYLPERTDGTLICHYRHRAHNDVFFWPGLQDITAFVDFTALAEAADYCGFEIAGYTSQTMFLLGCGLDRLIAEQLAGGADQAISINAEARKLTLPGEMGERFQVMALARDLDVSLCGFGIRDLSRRL